MPEDPLEAGAAAAITDQYAATVRDMADAHGRAVAVYYRHLIDGGMYQDHAAQLAAVYAARIRMPGAAE